VVGTRTSGAVLGARAFPIGGRGLLYLAVVDIHVDGERLEGHGVEPDVQVPFAIPWAAGADPQLEAAVGTLTDLPSAVP
jgi:carboxyl-terminal processing protease